MLPVPFESPYAWSRRVKNFDPDYYRTVVSRLKKRNDVEVVEKNNKKFLRITKNGYLHYLMLMAKLRAFIPWDNKWRLIMFDIPEAFKWERNRFRRLLKQNNFVKLQASVFISPYPLNSHAVEYLKQTGLMDFVRIIRVDQMDDDRELRERFKLPYQK